MGYAFSTAVAAASAKDVMRIKDHRDEGPWKEEQKDEGRMEQADGRGRGRAFIKSRIRGNENKGNGMTGPASRKGRVVLSAVLIQP